MNKVEHSFLPQQSARIVEAPSEAKTRDSHIRKVDDDEKPNPKTFPGWGDGHAHVSAPVAVVPLTANGNGAVTISDPWAELFQLAPDISLADEQKLKEQAELKGATPAALLELVKQNREPREGKHGPVAALYYLVKVFNRKSMNAALHHATADALGIQRPQIIEQPKCPKCQNVGQLSETEFCDCPQGALVKRMAEKGAAEMGLERYKREREQYKKRMGLVDRESRAAKAASA